MTGFSSKTVWLTRPLFQVEALKAQLEHSGCSVLHLPMFDIKSLPFDQAIRNTVLKLDEYDLVFFISTNAAKLGLDCFLHFWTQLPAGQQYFAVGPGTAEILEEEGLQVHFPTEQMNSEALLAIPELGAIEGRKALICRGVGGRETLATGLREKGVSVTYLELYERAVPEYSPDFLNQAISSQAPDAIVVSSAEALANLVSVFTGKWDGLLQVPLLVSSERIQQEAEKAGFTRLVSMTGASDPCIMSALHSLFSPQAN